MRNKKQPPQSPLSGGGHAEPANLAERIAKGLWWDRALTLVEGCTNVSPVCDNCWAESATAMRSKQKNEKIQERYKGLTNKKGKFNGKIKMMWKALRIPATIKKPTVFAVWNDLFHPDVTDEFICKVFNMISGQPHHTFIILTKRPDRMREWFQDFWRPDIFDEFKRGGETFKRPRLYLRPENCSECCSNFLGCLNGRKEWKDEPVTPNHRKAEAKDFFGEEDFVCDAFRWCFNGNNHGVAVEMDNGEISVKQENLSGPFPAPLKNVILGTTVENQKTADQRIPVLLQARAAVHLISCEPALEFVKFKDAWFSPQNEGQWLNIVECGHGLINWLVMGCESGHNRRPMDIEWVRKTQKQCEEAKVAFFLKQMEVEGKVVKAPMLDGKQYLEIPEKF